jgi:hypothetical protein
MGKFKLDMPNQAPAGDFEIERSNQAAKAANDNSRLMAQSALLINGGAATAIIALLTKEKVDPNILKAVPWALGFYTLGVVFGSCTLYYMTECLDRWNEFWEFYARQGNKDDRDRAERVAECTWHKVQRFFVASIISFAVGSACMAVGLFFLSPR